MKVHPELDSLGKTRSNDLLKILHYALEALCGALPGVGLSKPTLARPWG